MDDHLQQLKDEIYKVLYSPRENQLGDYTLEFEIITLLLKKNESLKQWLDHFMKENKRVNDLIGTLLKEKKESNG